MLIISDPNSIYRKYFHNGDRRDIFKVITEEFDIKKALYPGSYIHIAPSFYIQEVVYIDSFKKTQKFFDDNNFLKIIEKYKKYNETPIIRFYLSDYNKRVDEEFKSFDLLISLYGGFISEFCLKYLKSGGFFMANNSHGDAGMASLDNRLKFIGIIYYSNKQYRYTSRNLEKYFIPKKKNLVVTKEYIKEINKGISYTKTASVYVFQKIK